MNAKQIQALKLVSHGTRMRLTHFGNVLVSKQAKYLRDAGLIQAAPESWIAYELTVAGKAALARVCETPGCFEARGACSH